jgi:hypothetical protein
MIEDFQKENKDSNKEGLEKLKNFFKKYRDSIETAVSGAVSAGALTMMTIGKWLNKIAIEQNIELPKTTPEDLNGLGFVGAAAALFAIYKIYKSGKNKHESRPN